MFFDEPLGQFLDRRRPASRLAGVERVLATVDFADQALRLIPGGRDRPCRPDPDREALLLARDPVDQDEALAPGGIDSKAEARGIFVKEDVLSAANFGCLYNAFREFCFHATLLSPAVSDYPRRGAMSHSGQSGAEAETGGKVWGIAPVKTALGGVEAIRGGACPRSL